MKHFLFVLFFFSFAFVGIHGAFAQYACPGSPGACYATLQDCSASCILGGCAPSTTCNTNGGPTNTGGGPTSVALPNPLGTTEDIPSLLQKIVGWLMVISTPIAAGMIIFGAYQILFSQGDPDKFSTGKHTILYVVIGYAIILIGWGIVNIIQNLLTGTPPTP